MVWYSIVYYILVYYLGSSPCSAAPSVLHRLSVSGGTGGAQSSLGRDKGPGANTFTQRNSTNNSDSVNPSKLLSRPSVLLSSGLNFRSDACGRFRNTARGPSYFVTERWLPGAPGGSRAATFGTQELSSDRAAEQPGIAHDIISGRNAYREERTQATLTS